MRNPNDPRFRRAEQPVVVEKRRGNPSLLITLGAVLVALAILAVSYAIASYAGAVDVVYEDQPQPARPRPADAPGNERVPRSTACEVNNGHQVCDEPDGARIRSFAKDTGNQLGDALTEYDPVERRQVFRFFIVTYDPGIGDENWKTQPYNAGERDMTNKGMQPRTDRPNWHPAVAAFLLRLQEGGADIPKAYAYAISESIPDRVTGECRQWSVRVRFEFKCDATSPTQVRLGPLGFESLPKPPDPEYVPPKPVPYPVPISRNYPLLVGTILPTLFLLLPGLFLVFRGIILRGKQQSEDAQATQSQTRGRQPTPIQRGGRTSYQQPPRTGRR